MKVVESRPVPKLAKDCIFPPTCCFWHAGEYYIRGDGGVCTNLQTGAHMELEPSDMVLIVSAEIRIL